MDARWRLLGLAVVPLLLAGCTQPVPSPSGTPVPTPSPAPAAPAFTVGPPEDVLKAHAFGLTDFPDGLMGVVRKDGLYHLFVGSFPPVGPKKTYTFRFVGPTLESLRPDPAEGGNAAAVLSPGPPGSYDDQIGGNGAAYLDPRTGRLYLWHQACKDIPEESALAKERVFGAGHYYAGYCEGIGLAVSDDMGRTFQKRGLVLRIGLTEELFVRNASIAYADTLPPAVVRNGDYLYMYYGDYSASDTRPERAMLARLPISDLDKNPQPWKNYHRGEFTGDAMGGPFTTVVERVVFPSVGYNTHLGKWLMVHPFESHVIYWRTSEDGIRWSEPQVLFRSDNERNWTGHPTLVGAGEDPGVTGKEFWVYYEHQPDERKYPPGGWMVRRKVSLG